MTEKTASLNPTPVDWDWANESLLLPIFVAVGLSLGYEINTLAPVDQKWKDRPFVEPPKEYKSRVRTTYEAVRMGRLHCTTSNKREATFDIEASFPDAQFWEVSLVEFRQFCDERNWQVPPEFSPVGYARVQTAAPVGSVCSGKVWTEQRKAEARAYRATHGLKKTAEHYKVSQATISKHIPAGKGKRKVAGPWAGLP